MEDYEKKYKDAMGMAEEIIRYYKEHNRGDENSIEDLERIFPELKESEDEKIRKGLIKGLSAMRDIHHHQTFSDDAININDALAWLEKHGEQKHINDTDEEIVNAVKDTSVLDMVEPKFKIGDWITDGEAVFHITSYDIDYGYQLETQKGTSFHFSDEKVESKYHLWTIQDAKDGDVLAEDTCIFIIQKLGDNSTSAKTYCTLYNDGDFDDGSILYFDIDSTKPATKEQCDLLFQKMKEVGYEWDAEKKELKKIEKKPAWSEKDDYNLQCMVAKVTYDIQKGYVGRNNELIDWLKSLMDRVKGKEY